MSEKTSTQQATEMRAGTIVRDAKGNLCRVKDVDGQAVLTVPISRRGDEQGATVRRPLTAITADPYAQGYIYGFRHGSTGMGTFSSSDQLSNPQMQDGFEDGYQDAW